MTYKEWFDEFANKHQSIVHKLLSQGLDKKQIIDYFDFDNMHQDCSDCTVPHHRSYIGKNFNNDWKKIMFKCNLG